VSRFLVALRTAYTVLLALPLRRLPEDSISGISYCAKKLCQLHGLSLIAFLAAASAAVCAPML
jgi:hypothetical protein